MEKKISVHTAICVHSQGREFYSLASMENLNRDQRNTVCKACILEPCTQIMRISYQESQSRRKSVLLSFRSYKKKCFFLLFYVQYNVLFDVESESEDSFCRSPLFFEL